MRAIWKGVISFSLVNINVRLYSATEDKDIRFNSVHAGCGGRIKMPRTCGDCGESGLAMSDIAKGYDPGDGNLIVLTEEDLTGLPLSTSRKIDVRQFVPQGTVDPIYREKTYYLEPEPESAKAYEMLREGIGSRVGVVKVALRQRERLALIESNGLILTLTTMLWPDEVRVATFKFMEERQQVTDAEWAMATQLIDSMMTDDLDMDEYSDEYRSALERVIEAKMTGRPVLAIESAPAKSDVPDLMAALRASIEKARAERLATEQAIPTPVVRSRPTKSVRAGQSKGEEKILAPVQVSSRPSRATRAPKVANQSK